MHFAMGLISSLATLSAISLVLSLEDSAGCNAPCDDTDGDAICDSDDKCPGYNDQVDSNMNGVPDDCQDFVGVSGNQFVLNGTPFHFVGSNTYYLMTYAADPSLRGYVDEVLEEAVAMGMKVVRTSAFNDGPQALALQTSPGVFDETVFRGLDYVVARCGALGLRLVLPLVNNWPDYGGMDQYVDWSPTATRHDDFYTDAYTRQYYQNYISTMLSRVNSYTGVAYRDDPTVMAWELANEPECDTDPSGDTLVAWIDEMSAFLKRQDSRHLVTTGLEGFYQQSILSPSMIGSSGTDFIRDHLPAGVDYAVAHSWPDTWGLDYDETMTLLERQIDDAATVIGKPFVLEEFGKVRDQDGASPETSTTTRDTFFAGWLERMYGSASGGAMYWIAYHDAYPDYDGFGVYYPADSTSVAILIEYAASMSALR